MVAWEMPEGLAAIFGSAALSFFPSAFEGFPSSAQSWN